MGGRLSGPGVGLPLPQYLYPSELSGAPSDWSNNQVQLAPGQAIAIPPGGYWVSPGSVSILQFNDPVIGTWRTMRGVGWGRQPQYVLSDGFNFRVANFTGCPVCAVVTNAGTGYPTVGTTCVSSTGGSTWAVVVGGMLSVTTVSTAGSGYGVAPLVFLPAPPTGGIQATAYATIASGTVSGVTLTNVGGGYTSAPAVTILPSPYDPNLLAGNAIVNAVASVGVVNAGSVAGVICTNPGNVANPTLTISGTGGASATAVAQRLLTLTGVTIWSAGTNFVGGAAVSTVGGVPSSVAVNTNPEIEGTNFLPRPAQALLAAVGNSLVSVSSIYDGGLFLGAIPSLIVNPPAGALITTTASVTGLVGSANDVILLQPAP